MKNYDEGQDRNGERGPRRDDRFDRGGRRGMLYARDDDNGDEAWSSAGREQSDYPQSQRGDDWSREHGDEDLQRYAGVRGRSGYREYPRSNEDHRAYDERGRGEQQRRPGAFDSDRARWSGGDSGGRDYSQGSGGYRRQDAQTYGGAFGAGQHRGGVNDSDDDGDFDPDYRDWRNEQMKALDDDYKAYRKEKQSKFSEEFDKFRKTRERSAPSSQTGETKSGASAKTNN